MKRHFTKEETRKLRNTERSRLVRKENTDENHNWMPFWTIRLPKTSNKSDGISFGKDLEE